MQEIILAAGAAVSAAGVAGSAQPTNNVGSDYTVTLTAINIQATRARVGIEDSADGTTWTPLAVWEISGPVSQFAQSKRAYDAPGRKIGLGYQARLMVYEIVGGSATFNASISWNS